MNKLDLLWRRAVKSPTPVPARNRMADAARRKEAACVRAQRPQRTGLSLKAMLLLAGGAVVVGAACAGRRSLDELPTQLFVGHYSGVGGGSWFRRCGAEPSDSAWWVTFTGVAVEQRDSLRREGEFPDASLFVRWRAAMTEGGEVGPRGPGVPALLVRDIIEVRDSAPGDCST
jgi:hypothetical protein